MLDKQRLRAFLLGGAVGALAGIAFAPRSGRELRGSISNRAGEARERGREAYFDAQERFQERLSKRRFEVDPDGERSNPSPQRDSQESSEVSHGGPRSVSTDSDELRERIRATRNRLRGRLGGPEDGGLR